MQKPAATLLVAFLTSAHFLCMTPETYAKSPKKGASYYLSEKPEWFRSEEGKRIASNIISHQSELGGWPKNTSTTDSVYQGDKAAIHGTFDNKATTDELRFLAKAWNATQDKKVKKSFLLGLDLILKAQYPSGGWPQSYPPDRQYHRFITFNDNAMIRLMLLLREVAEDPLYDFVGTEKKKEAAGAFERGVSCILKCQIVQNGILTVWCAQHDENDYTPQPGRKYELASLSGAESVGIVSLLMSLQSPTPKVITSVDSAVEWFRKATIRGIRLESQRGTDGTKDLVVVSDPEADPLWARFYELGSFKPLFCDRDSIPKYSLAEIGRQRRTGYRWYGDWPRKLIDIDYPAWKAKLRKSTPAPNSTP